MAWRRRRAWCRRSAATRRARAAPARSTSAATARRHSAEPALTTSGERAQAAPLHFGLPPELWLISGIPGAGKSTVAHALAARFERGAHVEGESLWRQIVAGREMPDRDLEGESERQYELTIRNQCLLARSYAEAGITPVLDFVVVTAHHLDAYRHYLMGGVLRFVVLAPTVEVVRARDAGRREPPAAERFVHLDGVMRAELAGVGLWVDSSALDVDETVDAIMSGRKEALLR